MKGLASGAIIFTFAIFVLCTGCGSSRTSTPSSSEQPQPTSLLITWSSDGNPLVPVCNGATQNCKKDLTVLDKTNGAEVTVAITASNYTAPNAGDTYAVRVNGFDGEGNSISSEYEPVTVE